MSVRTQPEEAVYELLENTAGRFRIARGVLETVRSLERGRARTVLVAANVQPTERLDIVRFLCEQKGIPIIVVSDKVKLGKAAGLEVGASCVAVPVSFDV